MPQTSRLIAWLASGRPRARVLVATTGLKRSQPLRIALGPQKATACLDEAERCARGALLYQERLLACGTPDEIKGLMPGTVLEVRAAGARLCRALLRAHWPEVSITPFGDRVHVVTSRPEAAAAEAHGLLERAGLGPVEIKAIAPSLEDVFLSALGGKAGEKGAAPSA